MNSTLRLLCAFCNRVQRFCKLGISGTPVYSHIYEADHQGGCRANRCKGLYIEGHALLMYDTTVPAKQTVGARLNDPITMGRRWGLHC
jgi:hypothetical protein